MLPIRGKMIKEIFGQLLLRMAKFASNFCKKLWFKKLNLQLILRKNSSILLLTLHYQISVGVRLLNPMYFSSQHTLIPYPTFINSATEFNPICFIDTFTLKLNQKPCRLKVTCSILPNNKYYREENPPSFFVCSILHIP